MPRTVLVVDDSISMRQMVSFTLQRAGYATVDASNGQEGLKRLDQSKVDLIITDLNMPEMDGIEFIRQLRTRMATKHTPVLMLTTESVDSKKQQGKAAGATGWIVKPFHPEKLIQVISRLLP